MLNELTLSADLCVVGGGMAGVCAAIAAARHGTRVVLMHERPVLGGNASSEIRMWICGAFGRNNRETGILEEIALENLYRNPTKSYAIWDTVLYDNGAIAYYSMDKNGVIKECFIRYPDSGVKIGRAHV